MFQNYALFPHLTIAENIAFGLSKLSKTEINQRVAELMQRFRLVDSGDMAKRFPRQISGGQQQRVALARAMAAEPGSCCWMNLFPRWMITLEHI